MRYKRVVRNAVVVVLLTITMITFAADDVLQQAKQLLSTSHAQAAYDLLNPLQEERAGQPEYDFLLGRAALELGRHTEAVFALERVLAVLPDNGPARALIAQATSSDLEWEPRFHLIVQSIVQSDADVVCLCELNHFGLESLSL